MADNLGVLGSASAITIGTTTVYTCPVGKAARVKIYTIFQGALNSDVGLLVHGSEVARTGAMTASHYCYSNGGAGVWSGDVAAKPDGKTAATTAQPSAPIYWLSAGQTIQYTIATANLLSMGMDVVGVEVAL